MALFPLDGGEKWPTSTWTSVVKARPIRPIQAQPVQGWTQADIWEPALPARPLPTLRGESDRRASNPSTPDRNHFNLHFIINDSEEVKERKEDLCEKRGRD